MALNFPHFNPVLVKLYGPLQVRWYGLSYVLGIVLGYFYVKKINQKIRLLTATHFDFLLNSVIIGIVLGGRLGYVCFYDTDYYFYQNPWAIFKVWEGGMSFHGGFLGVGTALMYTSKKFDLPAFRLYDVVSVAAPIGLFFGRIANFINGELYGRVTDLPWAVKFPAGGFLPRHPSQLYEAFGEGLILFCLLYYLQRKEKYWQQPGVLAGIFALGYGIIRFLIEFVREPNQGLDNILGMTMGQLLCLPMIMAGLLLIFCKAPTSHE